MPIINELEKSKQVLLELNPNSYRMRKSNFFSTTVMAKTTLIILLLALSGFGLGSCKTLYIPVDNFKKLFDGMDSVSLMKETTFRAPKNEKLSYLTYPIDSINCVDRKGNPVVLESTPTLKIEIIYSNNKKSVVNFQTIRVNNDRIGPIETSNELVYYDMLSPFNSPRPGDTLSTADRNRAPSSYYVYGNGNVPSQNRTREIPISEIKKITVLRW